MTLQERPAEELGGRHSGRAVEVRRRSVSRPPFGWKSATSIPRRSTCESIMSSISPPHSPLRLVRRVKGLTPLSPMADNCIFFFFTQKDKRSSASGEREGIHLPHPLAVGAEIAFHRPLDLQARERGRRMTLAVRTSPPGVALGSSVRLSCFSAPRPGGARARPRRLLSAPPPSRALRPEADSRPSAAPPPAGREFPSPSHPLECQHANHLALALHWAEVPARVPRLSNCAEKTVPVARNADDRPLSAPVA